MKKYILTFIIVLSSVTLSLAEQKHWENTITVTFMHINTKITFGMDISATDSFDFQYDVPHFGTGSLTSYFITENGNMFKDIRAMNTHTIFNLKIENSNTTNEKIKLTWKPEKLPQNFEIYLIDTLTNDKVDMKTSSKYYFPNTKIRYLDIEVIKKD